MYSKMIKCSIIKKEASLNNSSTKVKLHIQCEFTKINDLFTKSIKYILTKLSHLHRSLRIMSIVFTSPLSDALPFKFQTHRFYFHTQSTILSQHLQISYFNRS